MNLSEHRPHDVLAAKDVELAPDDAARLLAAAADLASAREVARVMEVVRRSARELTRADGVTFVLREGEVVHYADEDAIAPLWKGRRFPASACISGWAMIHRQPAVIEDITVDPRIPQDAYRATFVKSLAMVPVRVDDPVAAIGAYWARPHRATPREVRLLEALAGLAAPALANQALHADLRQALEARDQFLSIASHELRTPIAALRLQLGLAERSIENGRDPSVLRRNVGNASATAARLATMVDRLLDLSMFVQRRVQLEREPLDLLELVEGVVESLRPGAASPIEVRGEPVRGEWDRVRLEQIVQNLVANAVKFGRGKPVTVTLARDGDLVHLAVQDHGIGIPIENQGRVFERFERAVSRRQYGGFGLGLWLVSQNVEAHGGSVTLTSTPGEGSTFHVSLPGARDAAAATG